MIHDVSRAHRSLRLKGLVFIAFLVAYSAFAAVYFLHEKEGLLQHLEEFRRVQEVESVLLEANLAVFDAYGNLFLIGEEVDRPMVVGMVHEHVMVLIEKYQALQRLFPEQAAPYKQLVKRFAEAVVEPSPKKMRALKEALAKNKEGLDSKLIANRELQEERFAEYHRRSDEVAMSALLLGLLGLVILGVGTSLFFGRMAGDVRTLQKRVVEIMKGYRGAPLELSRNDELGSLIDGVNHMARELEHREQELAMERQERFHREQKGFLGHFAAGLVHEIGNPVTAIVGLNRELLENPELECHERGEFLGQIQRYAERLAVISEDLTQLAAPLHAYDQLLDLNRLVRDVAGLLRYDERWYGIDVDLELNPQLPAIKGRDDQLNQVVMNVLINSFDAIREVDGRKPSIQVATRIDGDGSVQLSISDNGIGMDEETQGRCFEAFYTTKDGKRNTGLGLSLCQSIVNAHEGSISIESERGVGTTVRAVFPAAVSETS